MQTRYILNYMQIVEKHRKQFPADVLQNYLDLHRKLCFGKLPINWHNIYKEWQQVMERLVQKHDKALTVACEKLESALAESLASQQKKAPPGH